MKTYFYLFLFLVTVLFGGCGVNESKFDEDGDGFVNCYEATQLWPRYRDPFGCLEEGPEWQEDPEDPGGPMYSSYIYGSFNPVVHDCDDGDLELNPGAAEVCDGIDNDCDGLWDEGESADDLANDCDDDGFVALELFNELDDCDPWDAATYPGAPEIPEDGRDNNCDGCVDEDETACEDTGSSSRATGCACSAINSALPTDPGCRCSSVDTFPIALLPIVGYLLRRKRRT